ncbi:phage/plasmid replication protein [Teredinibacter sp. KSP-S5-2]|uniref:phage/plasmid replication domain-containing protein n=1 Tax=Teredinibacter sp. KSP-S5-2 TaxID=3034506 RepID=UPI0029347655|nr:phage/plasmid replication protein [Teredinibacter sp. KSP-S5-2]WNO11422.1 phage/plasmid replication protein [Teredinibacter sp. KSP-S5-2]WNO11428.1 phage/plasmid replication protein [Teredinibacter sp. KSP-S5-2]
MWFIDKLNVQQEYDFRLPIVGEHGVLRYDLATGEAISDSPKSLKLEGSYSSMITIRSNGSKISIQGNPSRFNRTENVFGFTSFDDCVAVYNSILLRLDLPVLTKATSFDYLQGEDGTRAKLVSDGAMFDHIDFTRNFSVGKGAERAFIKALSGHRIGKGQEPYLYPNGMTVDWYKGSDLHYKKVYCKSCDLIKHQKKRLKKADDDQFEYYRKLINWCNDLGLLREEHSFKQTFLRRKKLCFYGLTKESDFSEFLRDVEGVIKRFTVMNTQYESVSDQLLSNNVVKSQQAANATQCVYLKWLHGDDLNLGRSQYYEHRRRLLSLGVDISMPRDITKMPLSIRSNDLIDIKSVAIPDWYRLPLTAPRLSLVA